MQEFYLGRLWRTKGEDRSRIPGMGGERASGTRQRLAGQICYQCKAPLPAPHQPGEHLCARCEVAKAPKKRVYMSFMLRKGWFCQFLEPDLQTAISRKLSFADVEKVRELAKRGGGLPDLETAAALASVITQKRP
jgi:hypothetical protein